MSTVLTRRPARHLTWRSRGAGLSMRIPVRPFAVTVLLGLLTVVLIIAFTAAGEYHLSMLRSLEAVLGHGRHLDVYVARDVRLPRILLGALVGSALGLTGAIFQAQARNALASPDILGINEGASMVGIILIYHGASLREVPFGAFAGAIGVMLLLVLFGGLGKHFSMGRLLMVGISINTVCGLVIRYQMSRPTTEEIKYKVANWLAGSVASATWTQVALIAASMVVLVPVCLALSQQFNTYQLGEDVATSLGVATGRLTLTLMALSGLLAALVVSVAGPVGFVAFIAPHIAWRLARTSSAAALPVAMGVGAVLVLVADYVAKRLFEPVQLPLGVTMTVLGAPYLLYLILRSSRDVGIA